MKSADKKAEFHEMTFEETQQPHNHRVCGYPFCKKVGIWKHIVHFSSGGSNHYYRLYVCTSPLDAQPKWWDSLENGRKI